MRRAPGGWPPRWGSHCQMACQGAVARYPPAGGRPRLIPGRGVPQHAPDCGDKHFGEETAPRRQPSIYDYNVSITPAIRLVSQLPYLPFRQLVIQQVEAAAALSTKTRLQK